MNTTSCRVVGTACSKISFNTFRRSRRRRSFEERAHDRRMARIANRAVIESTDLPLEGVAKGPDAARSVECLVGNTIDRKFLPLLQRRQLAAHAIHDRFASLAVFVDDAIRAPGQVVIDGVG